MRSSSLPVVILVASVSACLTSLAVSVLDHSNTRPSPPERADSDLAAAPLPPARSAADRSIDAPETRDVETGARLDALERRLEVVRIVYEEG